MKQTEQYQLSQWEQEDRILREDFNANNAKIDAALAAVRQEITALTGNLPRVAAGTYTGNGAATRTIPLGFTPKGVLVMRKDSQIYVGTGFYCYGGMAVTGSPCVNQNSGSVVVSVVDNGFQVVSNESNGCGHQSNAKGATFHYIAVG